VASPHGPRNARTFRYNGPFARFDHHRGTGHRERRGIWYVGLTLDAAIVGGSGYSGDSNVLSLRC
jgi:hypothetical protein